MELPSHLAALADETTIWVCPPLSVEAWCQQYVDTGQCRRDWRRLHALALAALAKNEPSGTSHAFAAMWFAETWDEE